METQITRLRYEDVDAVDALMRANSKTLGFLPRSALREYLERGWVLGSRTEENDLVGYLLYAENFKRFRITHLAVSDEFLGQGIAKSLVSRLAELTTTQTVMQLHCRRDFPAHTIWPHLKFVPLSDKPGRSSAGHPLVRWERKLRLDPQPSLFEANPTNISQDMIAAIIDTNIFFDLYERTNEEALPSKALDDLVEHVTLLVTDEMLVEIHRKQDSREHKGLKERYREFFRVEYDPIRAGQIEEKLKTILPFGTPNQLSDIRQLAKAAAGEWDFEKVFITRDKKILRKSKGILELIGLQVLNPINLITQVHRKFYTQLYIPISISGVDFAWELLGSDVRTDVINRLASSEGKRSQEIEQELNSFLAKPDRYCCEILRRSGEINALRVIDISSRNKASVDILTPILSKSHSGSLGPLIGQFITANTINQSVQSNERLVIIKKRTPSTGQLHSDLLEMGFLDCAESYIRFCFTGFLKRRKMLSEISKICPNLTSRYESMSEHNLEKSCSPVGLDINNRTYYLIPIRPHYAMNLFDTTQASSDLFGGKLGSLLRWNNVYFRAKTHHSMFKVPGRILWYVSHSRRSVVGISHLDDVKTGKPKLLFQGLRKFGTFTWKDILKVCHADLSREIMVLNFSHTFLFRNPVSLDTLREIYDTENKKLVLQSPSRVPLGIASRLLQKGYSKF